MSEHIPGTFDSPKPINGKKFAIGLLIGTLLFFVFCLAATYYGGRAWGNALSKRALEKERQIEMDRMKEHEAKGVR
ncbi:MAG: hypothetical protein CBB60_008485 [Armatimonadetes bacterium Cent15-Ar3]|jgi:hypothetical protein|nr:MAG: hypothetical protein CBB60_008485 [Armatimonadetes bacterium Cent15-Ar3]